MEGKGEEKGGFREMLKMRPLLEAQINAPGPVSQETEIGLQVCLTLKPVPFELPGTYRGRCVLYGQAEGLLAL